jgi:uncharacterized caspase-like protein/energy-coupling factor transporter ATP-binding protein EcfA2
MPRAIQAQTKTLWCLVIGVSHYEDAMLRSLPYAVTDAIGLATVLRQVKSQFARTEILLHPNSLEESPTRVAVQTSLTELTQKAQPQDAILLYFAGHGLLDEQQQAFLCLSDTKVQNLSTTGLAIATLLTQLSHCKAATQVIILDACHSGRMTLRASPMGDLLQQLQQTATHAQRHKQNFYALLSCDADEESLEFKDLEHGLFTYYLIQGLQGEAINAQGMVEIKNLYQYIYHHVLKYIDRRNQQFQLIYQQKRSQGDQSGFQKKLPLQNPKLIVEAIGDLVLSTNAVTVEVLQSRRALVLDGAIDGQASRNFGERLATLGGFKLTYWHSQVRSAIDLPQILQHHLQSQSKGSSKGNHLSLLYLRGDLIAQPSEELSFIFSSTTLSSKATTDSTIPKRNHQITVAWLRQQLRGNQHSQILILDAPQQDLLQAWIRELEAETIERLCLMVGCARDRDEFLLAISQVLEKVDRNRGLSAAEWIAGIQRTLVEREVWRDFRLLGVQQVMEVIPRNWETSDRPVDFGICPYMGLQAFGAQDATFFYGRADLTQQLIQAIQSQNFIAVVGASGSGKSSVVQAGLVAQLHRGTLIPDSDRWWIHSLRPGAEPLQNLAKVMAQYSDATAAECEGLLHLGGMGFVRWLRQQPQPQIVLILDQFEELFTLTTDATRDRLLTLLLETLTHAADKFKLVITLRADFVAACLEYPTFAAQLQTATLYMPLRLTPEDYRQVIEAPAQAVKLQVEPGLVDILLREIEQSTVDLPLLQFVLEQLWEWRDRTTGRLTLAAYRDQIGGLEGVLERRATEIYDSLDPTEQSIAQWIFLTLTQLGDGTEDTKRSVNKSELLQGKYPAVWVEQTLQKFIDAKLLVIHQPQEFLESQVRSASHQAEARDDITTLLDQMKAETTIEVAHEILIRHWSTLRWWLADNRDRLHKQQRLGKRAKEWENKRYHPDFLLQGTPLAEANLLLRQYRSDLRPLELTYIIASQRQQIRKRWQGVGLGLVTLGTIAGLGLWAWQEQQQTQLTQFVRYTTEGGMTPETAPQILSSLSRLQAGAAAHLNASHRDRALEDYRQLWRISSQLDRKMRQNPTAYAHLPTQQATTTAQQAEQQIVQILQRFQLPQLELQLQRKNFGRQLMNENAQYEDQYQGALKLTYQILMRPSGAGADLNNDGLLSENEEAFLPCATLAAIEALWRKYTDNRCGWTTGTEVYDQPHCRELKGATLLSTIVWQPNLYLAENRLQQCKLLPPRDRSAQLRKQH